jgi:hypothetical protein
MEYWQAETAQTKWISAATGVVECTLALANVFVVCGQCQVRMGSVRTRVWKECLCAICEQVFFWLESWQAEAVQTKWIFSGNWGGWVYSGVGQGFCCLWPVSGSYGQCQDACVEGVSLCHL